MNKVLHLFWGRQRPLSWLRLQTVVTFARHNPDWIIKVWWREKEGKQPEWSSHEQQKQYTGLDYFNSLRVIANVQVLPVPFDLQASDVHFSDYFRWYLLSTEGGFWSDFDIVYIRPMKNLPLLKGDVFVIKYNKMPIYPIGLLGALTQNGKKWFSVLANQAKSVLESTKEYQEIGCILLERHAKRLYRAHHPPEIAYPVFLMRDVKFAYFQPNSKLPLPRITCGLHWYAGADFSCDFENSLNSHNLTPAQLETNIIKAIQGRLL